MAENQLIIAAGNSGPQGAIGPQGATTFVVGPTGAAGATGIAGIVFPYNVSTGTVSYFNIGQNNGQSIYNQNGVEWTGISGTAFPAINYTFISSSQSAAIYYDNVYGASYSLEMTSNNAPAIFNNLVIFAGGVQGASFSGGSTVSGPQGPQGVQGNTGSSGLAGPTGPSSGWPVDTTLVDAQFINIGNGSGSLNIGVNGIDINGLSSSQPASILWTNNFGSSYSFWIDNTNGPIQIDVPITFTNQVISTLYLNSSILFENIYGGLTQAMLFSYLTSSTTAAIQSSNVGGSSYSWWFDNTNKPIQIDCPINFTGTVSSINGGFGAQGPQGPAGATGPAGTFGSTVSNSVVFTATASFNTNVVFNNTSGTASLVNGTVSVNNIYVDSSSLVWVQYAVGYPLSIGYTGILLVSSVTPGVNFVIHSHSAAGTLNVTDNSVIQYWIQN